MQCAHVMAMAVQKIFPDAKVTIGPWIENGFYYDFDMVPLTDRDLKKIKKEMVSRFILFFFHFELQRHYKLCELFISLRFQGTEFISLHPL